MKIIFTGGGSGGHFYPIISIAQALNRITTEKKLIHPSLYFFAPNPYNPGLLYDNKIEYKKTSSGKIRRYFSLLNILDFFKIIWGVISSTIDVFDIYPDVVFGKGGFGSFPTLMAARLLRIPVIIHESDTVPGRVNKWAGKFAHAVAISYPETAKYFQNDKKVEKVAYTGQPIQRELLEPEGKKEGAAFWELEESIPTILVLGGSLGAEKINNVILDILPELLKTCQVIHQTGEGNWQVVHETSNAILLGDQHKIRYKTKSFLTLLEQRMAAGAADLIITRAGSTLFEIASWGKASIVIPITDSNGDHQIKNAFSYTSSGAGEAIKEENLTPNVLLADIKRILQNPEVKSKMEASAKAFFKPDADFAIAKEILSVALSHEELE